MTSLPYMQLYVSDYLADTAHLNAQQHGAYMLLLMNYWQRGKPLDNTGDRLAYVARMTAEEWEDSREILSEFFIVDGNIWSHRRIENDLAKVREKSDQAKYAGLKSSVKRKSNARSTEPENESNETPTTVEHPLSDRSTFVEHPFNHKEEEEDIDKDENKDKDINNDFEQFWNIYPRKTGKGAARESFKRALKKTTIDRILMGAESYLNDPNRQNAFTALAATWLNQERWDDSPLLNMNQTVNIFSKADNARNEFLKRWNTPDQVSIEG